MCVSVAVVWAIARKILHVLQMEKRAVTVESKDKSLVSKVQKCSEIGSKRQRFMECYATRTLVCDSQT